MDPFDPGTDFWEDTSPPSSLSDRLAYTAALGLALSSNSRTPNLIYTYRDKELEARVASINRGVFIAFMLTISLLSAFYLWQGRMMESNQRKLADLEQQLAQYKPLVDQNLVVQTASKVKAQNQVLKEQCKDYLAVAVLSDLSALTPSNIRLTGVVMDLGRAQPDTTKGQQKSQGKEQAQGSGKSVVVEGVVVGDRQSMEASLAQYLMKLGGSPIFVDPGVHSSVVESYDEEGEVLRFTLKMGLM
jgi:hypothetical protein